MEADTLVAAGLSLAGVGGPALQGKFDMLGIRVYRVRERGVTGLRMQALHGQAGCAGEPGYWRRESAPQAAKLTGRSRAGA